MLCMSRKRPPADAPDERRPAREESRRERLAYRWCALAVLAAVVGALFALWRVAGGDGVVSLAKHALTSVLLLGKFVVFLGLREDGLLDPWSLALLVWLIDLCFAVALAGGLEGLERGVLGRWLRRARERALEVLDEYPGLGRMAFFGVVAFVLLPLAATGAVSGSFAARLIGLSRISGVGAIALGSFGTSFGFALLAVTLGARAEDFLRSPLLLGLGALGLVALGRLAYVRVTRRLKTR